VNTCGHCGQQYAGEFCLHNGEGKVSVADDSLDQMVQAASIPNLASLFRRAKETGAIGAVSVYGTADGSA